jgi:hypothetical protein
LDSMFERVIIFLRQQIEMFTENDSALDEADSDSISPFSLQCRKRLYSTQPPTQWIVTWCSLSSFDSQGIKLTSHIHIMSGTWKFYVNATHVPS